MLAVTAVKPGSRRQRFRPLNGFSAAPFSTARFRSLCLRIRELTAGIISAEVHTLSKEKAELGSPQNPHFNGDRTFSDWREYFEHDILYFITRISSSEGGDVWSSRCRFLSTRWIPRFFFGPRVLNEFEFSAVIPCGRRDLPKSTCCSLSL